MPRVSVSLSDHLYTAIMQIAEANGWSVSKTAAVIIERRLTEKNPDLLPTLKA